MRAPRDCIASSASDAQVGVLSWRLILDGALPGARNMARDHALALSLPADSAVLRLYGWECPTLSLGRNEPARGRYRPEAIAALDLDVVRRPTGGRAVMHWRELTYSVVMPVRACGGPRETYRWINGRIAAALAGLGVPAEIAPVPQAGLPLSAGPCFAAAAGGEITAGGRKLVGSAQLRIGDTLLQHGSILLADDQRGLESIVIGGSDGTSRPATLSELLGREPAKGELERALAAEFGLDRACVNDLPWPSLDEAELEERYRSAAWTWRR